MQERASIRLLKERFLMLRVFPLSLLLFSFCLGGVSFASSSVHEVRGDFKATTNQAKLVKALAKALDPESMTVTFVDGPKENGDISGLYLDIVGPSAGTDYRLDRFSLSGALVRLTPPSQWDAGDLKTFRPSKWEGLFNAELLLKESTAREALALFSRTQGDEQWRNLSLDFRPGKILLEGTYRVNGGMRAAFKITTGLELRGGRQIWLANPEVQINNDEQTQAIRSKIQEINPPADFDKLGIPLVLRTIKITDRELRIATGQPPRPLDGDTWKYVR